MEEYGQGISLVSMLQISSSRSHKIVNQSKIVAVRGLISNKIYLVLSTPKTGEFRLKVAECMIRSIWTRRSVVPPTPAIYVMFNILRMLSIYMSNNATSFNTWVLSLTHTHTHTCTYNMKRKSTGWLSVVDVHEFEFTSNRKRNKHHSPHSTITSFGLLSGLPNRWSHSGIWQLMMGRKQHVAQHDFSTHLNRMYRRFNFFSM